MTTITVQSIKQNPKKSIIHTTDGRQLGCWTNTLDKLGIEANATYEVEIETTDFGAIITKAKRIGSATAPSQTHESSISAQLPRNGHYRPTSPQDAERMFVCANLTALIRAGHIKADTKDELKQELWSTMQILRGLWKHTFGFDSLHQHMEAAE